MFCRCNVHQAIAFRDGGEGFARAGGHLYQHPGLVFRKGFVQVFDGNDLSFAKAGFVEGREALHIVADGVRLAQEFLQRIRAKEIVYRPRAIFFVFEVGEMNQLVCSFIGEADFMPARYI